mgnify:CR=1 FL=1
MNRSIFLKLPAALLCCLFLCSACANPENDNVIPARPTQLVQTNDTDEPADDRAKRSAQ